MLVARAFGHACRHLAWNSRSDQHLGQSLPEDDFLVEWCRTVSNVPRAPRGFIMGLHQYGESHCHW